MQRTGTQLTLRNELRPLCCLPITRDEQAAGKPVVEVNLSTTKGQTGTEVTDAALAELKHLKSLRTLNVTSSVVTEKGLAELNGITTLKSLNLRAAGVTDDVSHYLLEPIP